MTVLVNVKYTVRPTTPTSPASFLACSSLIRFEHQYFSSDGAAARANELSEIREMELKRFCGKRKYGQSAVFSVTRANRR